MMVSGPLSDIFGRKKILSLAAVLYAISAIASALAPSFWFLVVARMIGGLGVGASLIIAPMYIAEIAPPAMRGRMVSFNQLNIVIGISVAFFTNYLILKFGQSDAGWAQALMFGPYNWRWMLGLETLPAILYFFSLFSVPESPRWLVMKGHDTSALAIMTRASGEQEALREIKDVKSSLVSDSGKQKATIAELFMPAMRLVITIGVVVAVIQQITGINSVFFYAPMIFEQSGIGTDASFAQAILVGIINLVFTLVAIAFVDRLGRKPLLAVGLTGITISMFVLAFGFYSATYTLTPESIADLPAEVNVQSLEAIQGTTFDSDVAFKNAITEVLGEAQANAVRISAHHGRHHDEVDPCVDRHSRIRGILRRVDRACDVGVVLGAVPESNSRTCHFIRRPYQLGGQLPRPTRLPLGTGELRKRHDLSDLRVVRGRRTRLYHACASRDQRPVT